MAFVFYNPNPKGKRVGDCVIRAITKAMDSDWAHIYLDVCMEGLDKFDMPSSDCVWGSYLYKNGYRRNVIPNDAPSDYTIAEFAAEHPNGKYIMVTAERNHIVCVEDGNVYDTFDSSDEIPIYYWRQEIINSSDESSTDVNQPVNPPNRKM